MSLPEDLNPLDLLPSSGESAEAPNELGLTDTAILNHWMNKSSSFFVFRIQTVDKVQRPSNTNSDYSFHIENFEKNVTHNGL
jgi:hypothetical protein